MTQAPTTTRTLFIVISENQHGGLKASPSPYLHETELDAMRECERLATDQPGVKFHVFASLGFAQRERPVQFTKSRLGVATELPF